MLGGRPANASKLTFVQEYAVRTPRVCPGGGEPSLRSGSFMSLRCELPRVCRGSGGARVLTCWMSCGDRHLPTHACVRLRKSYLTLLTARSRGVHCQRDRHSATRRSQPVWTAPAEVLAMKRTALLPALALVTAVGMSSPVLACSGKSTNPAEDSGILLNGHRESVNSVDFAPDGSRLVSGGADSPYASGTSMRTPS